MSLLPKDGWTALLVGGAPKSLALLAAPASRALRIPLADASTRCKVGQGLFPMALDEDRAGALAETWTSVGFPARALRWQDCVEPPPARKVAGNAKVWLGEAALDVKDVGTLPWPELGVIHLDLVAPDQPILSLGESDEPERAERVAGTVTGLVDVLADVVLDSPLQTGFSQAAERRRDRAADKRQEISQARLRNPGQPREWLELYGAGIALRLRIDPGDFPYRSLEGEPALAARENYRRLLRLLRERAPNALEVGLEEVAPSTRKVSQLNEHEWRVAATLTRDRLRRGEGESA